MGRTLHEVFRIREVRDHRTGGTVVALNPPDTGSNRDPEIDVLRLVQPIQEGGIEALVDGKPRPRRIWNKIPDKIETTILNLALEEPDLSPRELAINFTDTKGSFVLEATVYRLLKNHGLMTTSSSLARSLDRALAVEPDRCGELALSH